MQTAKALFGLCTTLCGSNEYPQFIFLEPRKRTMHPSFTVYKRGVRGSKILNGYVSTMLIRVVAGRKCNNAGFPTARFKSMLTSFKFLTLLGDTK